MLDSIDSEAWAEFAKDRRRPRFRRGGSGELSVLMSVESARSNIYARVYEQQLTALKAIISSRTQLCNDVLMDVASNPSCQIRRLALKQLGESGDDTTIDFLAETMKNDDIEGIRKEAARAYSTLVSRGSLGSISSQIVNSPTKSPAPDISKINKILNTLIAKGMPTTMIDDALKSLVIQGGTDTVDILSRLLSKPQNSVRSAVIKATRFLDTDTAAPIIRMALEDEDPLIVAMAENELDTRWPDVVWE